MFAMESKSRMEYNLHLHTHRIRRVLATTIVVTAASGAFLLAQQPAGKGPGGGKGPARPVFSVSSSSFPDGGEIPLKNSFYGENKSPEFTFSWTLAGMPATAPDTLQGYAIIFHDIENATAKGPTDTLHWSAFNIPGTAKGLSEGLGGISRTAPATAPASPRAVPMVCLGTLDPALAPAPSITTSLNSTLSTPS
jgi:hypothetical protein